MIDSELLDILVCPENKTPVKMVDDDVIARVHVRRERGLMLAAQAMRHLSGQPAQYLVRRIDQEPLAPDVLLFCRKSLHLVSL